MEAVLKYDENDAAMRQLVEGLIKLGATIVAKKEKKTPYSKEFMEKMARGERDFAAGKGVLIDPSRLWE